jgi:murein DD-endopeptidase MepM/ murein hydrolase activator NlpD
MQYQRYRPKRYPRKRYRLRLTSLELRPPSPTHLLNPPNLNQLPQTIALNAGSANQPQPISNISPNQVATTVDTWTGASFPVENFQAYTSPFGYRQSPDGGYSQEFHYGLDMAAPEGSYVRNWWNGKVVEVSDDSNCGTSVVLESGNWTHIYCHMEGHVEQDDRGRYLIDREGGLQIYEGQQVIAGSRIGRVGMTGRTTGPHLHWGLKYDGNWVDPAYVLQAMYVSQQGTTAQRN